MGATVEAAHALVGQTIWVQFFGTAVITVDEICPMQLRQLVFRQLMWFSTLLGNAKHEALQAQEQQRLDDHCYKFAKLRKQLDTHNAQW